MKIILAGGGSGGPVSPLLAVAAEIKKQKPGARFLFVGTSQGPERAMVEAAQIEFETVPAAKWRRYFSLQNFIAPIVFLAGLIKSILIVSKFRPDIMFTAGGFVGVPVAFICEFFGVKIMVHQQDARIGLANKLVVPLASQITTSFEPTAKQFYAGSGLFRKNPKPAAEWVGNPVRPELFSTKVDAKKHFRLHDELPILLILGGATGALQVNKLVAEVLPKLIQSYQVVHQTGLGKNTIQFQHPNYHPYELIPYPEYAAILRAAHLVVARAGLSTISELSALGKTALVIPMPYSHQEDNAKILALTGSAAVLMRDGITSANLLEALKKLTFDEKLSKNLSANISNLMPHDAAGKIAKLIIKHGPDAQA